MRLLYKTLKIILSKPHINNGLTYLQQVGTYHLVLFIVGLFFVQLGSVAQTTDIGTYNMQFSCPNYDEVSNTFCVNLQIQSADSETFVIGDYGIWGNYNANGLTYLDYTPLAFVPEFNCDAGNNPYQFIQYNGADSIYVISGFIALDAVPCHIVGPEWTSMGTLCFSVSDVNTIANLSVSNMMTDFYNVNGQPHLQGNFANYNSIANESSFLTDSLALVGLYNATNGADWTNNTNWLTDDLSTWHGVTLINEGCGVKEVTLDNNNLEGNLPSELGNLNNLTTLSLSDNQLSGTIPSELSNLSNLNSIQLQNNQFTFGNLAPHYNNWLNLTGCNNTPCFRYAPQDVIPTYKTTSGDSLFVVVGDVANNTYTWYEVGNANPVYIAIGDSVFVPTDVGVYYCEVSSMLMTNYNESAQSLIMISTPFEPLEIEIVNRICNGDGAEEVSYIDFRVNNALPPFTISAVVENNNEEQFSFSTVNDTLSGDSVSLVGVTDPTAIMECALCELPLGGFVVLYVEDALGQQQVDTVYCDNLTTIVDKTQTLGNRTPPCPRAVTVVIKGIDWFSDSLDGGIDKTTACSILVFDSISQVIVAIENTLEMNNTKAVALLADLSEGTYGLYLNCEEEEGLFRIGDPLDVSPLDQNQIAYHTISTDKPINVEEQGRTKVAMQVYPNPTSLHLYIRLLEVKEQGLKPIGLYIYDCTGQVILQERNTITENTPIDVSELNAGVYLVKVILDNGVCLSQKVIKQGQ